MYGESATFLESLECIIIIFNLMVLKTHRFGFKLSQAWILKIGIYNIDIYIVVPLIVGLIVDTVCPRSSDPFYIVRILYKMGHYFLDTN